MTTTSNPPRRAVQSHAGQAVRIGQTRSSPTHKWSFIIPGTASHFGLTERPHRVLIYRSVLTPFYKFFC